MNKREAVMSLLDSNQQPAVTPAAFFLHFDPAYHRGQAAVEKHLEYFRFTGMDFVKIQYEHSFPRNPDIQRPEDWAKMPFYPLDFYEAPLRVVEGLVKAAKAEALVILTLYSPFMFAGQAAGEDMVVRHIHENPQAVQRGMQTITDSLMGFVQACIRLGLDGFYTSTQGGEAGRVDNPELFNSCIKPYDLALMEEINRQCAFNILHICDYRLPYHNLEMFHDYPGHVINTSFDLAESELTSRQVADYFGRPVMGGMKRKGALSSGTIDEVRAEAEQVLADAPDRFILGADCTMLAGTPWDNPRAAVETAHAYHRQLPPLTRAG
jgi:uroporphyrinogen decarboxylase